jgi:two-component system CheB/CheR fusion protein
VSLRDRMLLFAETAGVPMDTASQVERQTALRDIVLDAARIAQVIVDVHGNVVMANQLARQLFHIESNDMGRPFQDFELSYRPIELRSLIDQANAENRVVAVTNLEYRTSSNETSYLDIQVAPLRDGDAALGVSISFDDVTRYHKLEEQLQRAQQEAETVNEELQAANEELQSTNEELETTNEELQSTNEELETTNEELQSTNEELETMNEELQSTNEELQTMNEELRDRTDELNNSNAFLGSILSSLRGGVAVVDKSFKIIIWNSAAEELWGLRSDEVKGQSLFSLDSGLPVHELRTPLRLCVSDEADGANHQELILNATNRRGRSIKCRVAVSPFRNLKGQRHGAVITMEEMGM